VSHHSDLIDTTEMYLRTVYELEEEGVVPLRARIAERLGQSGPTVSQTVARMERDGLVRVAGDRHLELTDEGRHLAVGVMRKHRLAERLLIDVIGLDWEDVHIEACRWEHVMSEAVERRIVTLLDDPMYCPHGNPIPGLDELGVVVRPTSESRLVPGRPAGAPGPVTSGPDHATPQAGAERAPLVSLTAAAQRGDDEVVVDRISEQLQPDAAVMHTLTDAGLRPGLRVRIIADGAGVQVRTDGVTTLFAPAVTDHVFVRTG
jgi:DtxR family Mn-dependent transcriptional regulator